MKRRSFMKFFGLVGLTPSVLLAKSNDYIKPWQVELWQGGHLKTEPFVIPDNLKNFQMYINPDAGFVVKNGKTMLPDQTGNGNDLITHNFEQVIHFQYSQNAKERLEVVKILTQTKKELSGSYSSMEEFRKVYE